MINDNYFRKAIPVVLAACATTGIKDQPREDWKKTVGVFMDPEDGRLYSVGVQRTSSSDSLEGALQAAHRNANAAVELFASTEGFEVPRSNSELGSLGYMSKLMDAEVVGDKVITCRQYSIVQERDRNVVDRLAQAAKKRRRFNSCRR